VQQHPSLGKKIYELYEIKMIGLTADIPY